LKAGQLTRVKEQGVAEGYNDLGREYGGAYVNGRSDDARMTEKLTRQAKAAAAKAGKTFGTNAEYRKWHTQQKEKQGVAEAEKDTSRMNKQHQDFYNKNPNFKRDDRETTSVGGRLATKVTPKTAQVAKKPMTPFEGKVDFAKKLQGKVDTHNKAVVQTKKDIGSRVADIGPGGKEYNVKTDAAWDAAKKKVAEGYSKKK
jgi:hypothetical protein